MYAGPPSCFVGTSHSMKFLLAQSLISSSLYHPHDQICEATGAISLSLSSCHRQQNNMVQLASGDLPVISITCKNAAILACLITEVQWHPWVRCICAHSCCLEKLWAALFKSYSVMCNHPSLEESLSCIFPWSGLATVYCATGVEMFFKALLFCCWYRANIISEFVDDLHTSSPRLGFLVKVFG